MARPRCAAQLGIVVHQFFQDVADFGLKFAARTDFFQFRQAIGPLCDADALIKSLSAHSRMQCLFERSFVRPLGQVGCLFRQECNKDGKPVQAPAARLAHIRWQQRAITAHEKPRPALETTIEVNPDQRR
jgi:hypothetical protein